MKCHNLVPADVTMTVNMITLEIFINMDYLWHCYNIADVITFLLATITKKVKRNKFD